ncbi:MAG: hypothetical protein Q9164_003876 [Protoblastenia rupestris]
MSTHSLTFLLPSGRSLGYALYGAHPPSIVTTTVFYFHGTPGSRLEGAVWHAATLARSVRLIAIDRPGFGLSSSQENRTLMHWPDDVLALADHLGIDTFRVLGTSGGGPYVLACAKVIPASRMQAAAIVSGMYPCRELMSWGSWAMMELVAWMPGVYSALLEWYVGRAVRDWEHPEVLEEMVLKSEKRVVEVDRRVLRDDVLRKWLLDSMREGLRQGCWGTAWEVRLFGSSWGFGLQEIEGVRVSLWHGGLDRGVPSRMARKAAEMLNGAELRVFEEEGHISLVVNKAEEILEDLVVDG